MIDADRLLSLLALLHFTPSVTADERQAAYEAQVRTGTLEAVETWVRSQVDAPTLREIEGAA